MSLCDEQLVWIFVGQLAEEELLLAGGGNERDEFGLIAGDEFVGSCHVEDELATDEFGGGVILVKAGEQLGAVASSS